MELEKIIILMFLIKIICSVIFIFINSKISYSLFVNIISTFVFFIFSSLGDIHLVKYLLSEICGFAMGIFVYVYKKDQERYRNQNQHVEPNINQVVEQNIRPEFIEQDKYVIVIQPDGTKVIGIIV
jgi:predicted membrane protein